MNFQLADNVLAGLKLLSTELDLEQTKKLIINSVLSILGYEKRPVEYCDDKEDIIKQCEAAILTIFALSVRHGYGVETLKTYLENQKIPKSAIIPIIEVYQKYHEELVKLAEYNESSALPKVTDINWNLSYNIKGTGNQFGKNSNDELTYKINLGNFNEVSGDRNTVTEFECNTEELQSLINKLKDIERHCDKICIK